MLDLGKMMLTHILSLLIWLPILCGVMIIIGERCIRSDLLIKIMGLAAAILTGALAIMLYLQLNSESPALQCVENYAWIPLFNIKYALGVDGLSVLFIVLNCFTNLIMILSAWGRAQKSSAEYIALFLFSTGILNGLFAADDAVLFYVFWEASTLPVLLGIGIWGGTRRSYAAIKFFLFNMLGSLMMLAAFLYLYNLTGTFSISAWENIGLSSHVQDWLFLAFFAAFAVKMPMWPVHTWFADLHSEAPLGGAIALTILMLKTGAYGFLRFALPIASAVHQDLLLVLIALALIAIIYIGFAAIVQKDIRRLVAYASVSHMGITMLGIFMAMFILRQHNNGLMHLSQQAAAILSMQGAVFQMITHAFAAGGLFILTMLLFERFGSALVQDYQGLAGSMPGFAFFFVLFALANVGLPGTAGFIGEFFVIIAALQGSFWVAVIAGLTLIISPAYMLWLVKRVIFGGMPSPALERVAGQNKGLTKMEWLIMLLLAVPVIYFGFFPHVILNLSYASSANLVNLVARGSL